MVVPVAWQYPFTLDFVMIIMRGVSCCRRKSCDSEDLKHGYHVFLGAVYHSLRVLSRQMLKCAG